MSATGGGTRALPVRLLDVGVSARGLNERAALSGAVLRDLFRGLAMSVLLDRDISVQLAISTTPSRFVVAMKVINAGDGDLRLESVRLTLALLGPELDRAYAQDSMLDGRCEFGSRVKQSSDGCVGLTASAGTSAVVVGFIDHSKAEHRIDLEPDDRGWRIEASCLREGVPLRAGEALEISPLEVARGTSLAELMHGYSKRVASRMRSRAPKPVLKGWCSWYRYYGNETEADVIANLNAIAASPLRDRINVIQIDDGWNLPYNGHRRMWGDWEPGGKFRAGMRALRDRIHDAGFRAGLWLAPFAVEGASRLAREHPDWLVQRMDPAFARLRPAPVYGNATLHALDLTHPGSIGFIEQTFDRVFNEWGYDYVKLDFLKFALIPGLRRDPSRTTIEAFRDGLGRIYELAGRDRFVLGCTAPSWPCVGLCDAMRVGMDIGGVWHPPLSSPSWPYGNCSVKSAAYGALFRQWMHGTLWQNDPDCLVVRDRPVPDETRFFERLGGTIQPADASLSDEEAGFWARLVWLTGGMGTFSESWDELAVGRQRLLAGSLEPNDQAVRWVDWYGETDVGLLRTVTGPLKVGLFNLSDETRRLHIPLDRFALGDARWSFAERLSGDRFAGAGEVIAFPELPPHAGRIWQLEP